MFEEKIKSYVGRMETLKDIQSNPDCHSFVSQEEVIWELGL